MPLEGEAGRAPSLAELRDHPEVRVGTLPSCGVYRGEPPMLRISGDVGSVPEDAEDPHGRFEADREVDAMRDGPEP